MSSVVNYLLQVIIISGILYGYYHLALRNKRFHHYNRFYLLSAAIASIIIPFLKIPVYISREEASSSFILQTLTSINTADSAEPVGDIAVTSTYSNPVTWQAIAYWLYAVIAILILFRIILSIARIGRIVKNNPVKKLDNIHFVDTNEPGTPFSFFRWLFWDKKIELDSDKGQQMFRHELFHIQQKHSWDVLFTEMLTMIFWINPFFYLIKKEVRAIHEFLADQFAIKEYSDWKYAELLLMQALNTRQQLVNPFFHNQIKRRIAMITTSKKTSYQYLRKLMVLPVAAIAAILFAFSYKDKKNHKKTSGIDKMITVVIDAGHGGQDGGAKSADGTLEKDITLAIATRIKTLNEDENIKIVLTRDKDELPELKSRTDLGNEQQANLFLAIHVNASTKKEKGGFEVVIPPPSNNWYSETKILASILFGYLNQSYPSERSITENKNLWVFKNSNCPAALIECGYISNDKDLAFISKPENQDKIARSILSAIDQYVMQQKNADWNERKRIMADTIKPKIEFVKDPATGKFEGTYNGRKINEIILYEPTGSLGFMMGGGEMIVIGKKLTGELRSKYGNDLLKDVKIEKGIAGADSKEKIFDKVEIEPAFPGGVEKWRQFLRGNVKSTIPVDKGAAEGKYTVIVMFTVSKDGKVSEVKALTSHGYGMEEEAIRVINSGPDWLAGIDKGKKVAAIRKQPITFVIAEEPDRVQANADNKIFSKVEIEAMFPGGESKWQQYLTQHLDLSLPVKNKAPKGEYTAVIQFIVNLDGTIKDIKPLTKHGYGMEEEAIRVIRQGPRWIPAIQNGHQVIAYKKALVNFFGSKTAEPVTVTTGK